jgi:hypothetical protein
MDKYSLIGVDGNAFAVMGYVRKAMRSEGYSEEQIKAFTDKATSGDYNNLLAVCDEQIEEINKTLDNQ